MKHAAYGSKFYFIRNKCEDDESKISLEIKPTEKVINDGGTIDSTLSSPDDTSEVRIKKKRKSFRKRLRRTASRRTASRRTAG